MQADKAYLVELQCVQQLIQLPIFSNFLELHIVLLQTMERQLRFIIDENLQRLSKS